jgi:hypothetical protein
MSMPKNDHFLKPTPCVALFRYGGTVVAACFKKASRLVIRAPCLPRFSGDLEIFTKLSVSMVSCEFINLASSKFQDMLSDALQLRKLMAEHLFSLTPFLSDRCVSPVRIVGTIARHAGTLSLSYRLRCHGQPLLIPAPAAIPERRHGLWKDTCFELFLAAKGAPAYWELNLSPAGHWNVYRFSSYRKGMAEESAFAALPLKIAAETDGLSLGLEIDLNNILPAALSLEAGSSAVLRHADGAITWWALAHPGPQPDFHDRSSFRLFLPSSA